MQIQLMRCTAEKERLDKSSYIKKIFAIDGCLIDECSIQDPIILIQKTTAPTVTGYNYMYIPEFKRYYYITWKSINKNMWELSGHIDVLYTYKNEILNNRAIIEKVENSAKGNLYLNDGSFVMDSRKYNQVINFPSGFSETGYNILICSGGA